MRPHGKAQVSQNAPRALGICQRCGFQYNLGDLQWQFDWQQGPRLFNLRIKVCQTCLDAPQQSGRTIVLPPDPIPVAFALPEDFVDADNPLSALGYNPANAVLSLRSSLSGNIGNMTLNGGIDAAFDGNLKKRYDISAGLSISNSSFNTVGKNWNADPSGVTLTKPSTVAVLTHIVANFTLTAPTDVKFLNKASGGTAFAFQGSSDGINWTSLYASSTAGTVGESITASSTSTTAYQFHRVAITGDGISRVAIAQAQFNVSDAAVNDI